VVDPHYYARTADDLESLLMTIEHLFHLLEEKNFDPGDFLLLQHYSSKLPKLTLKMDFLGIARFLDFLKDLYCRTKSP
jgi:hypothetical protein